MHCLLLILAQCVDPATLHASDLVYAPYVSATTAFQGTLLTPGTQGAGIRIEGARAANDGNSTADVTLGSYNLRASGLRIVDFAVQQHIVAEVASDGTVVAALGQQTHGPAAFVDGSGGSGHVSLTVGDGLYPVIGGRLGSAAGYDADNNRVPYGGLHGDVTLYSVYAREAGLGVAYVNSLTQSATDLRWYVDYNGGMGQHHGLSRAQFGEPARMVMVNGGQHYMGQLDSTLMYDTAQKNWYFMKGEHWVRLIEAPELDLILARLDALESR